MRVFEIQWRLVKFLLGLTESVCLIQNSWHKAAESEVWMHVLILERLLSSKNKVFHGSLKNQCVIKRSQANRWQEDEDGWGSQVDLPPPVLSCANT